MCYSKKRAATERISVEVGSTSSPQAIDTHFRLNSELKRIGRRTKFILGKSISIEKPVFGDFNLGAQ